MANKTNTQNVRPAQESDLAQIVAIEESHSIRTKDPEKVARDGFLVYIMPQEELRTLVQDNSTYLRVYDKNGVQGYMAAYSNSTTYAQNTLCDAKLNDEGKRILQEPYCYIRHIAKKPNASPRVAVELENAFHAEMASKGYEHSIGEIAIEPPNERSRKFHESMGCRQIGTRYDFAKNILWGIFAKKLKGEN